MKLDLLTELIDVLPLQVGETRESESRTTTLLIANYFSILSPSCFLQPQFLRFIFIGMHVPVYDELIFKKLFCCLKI